MRLTDDLTSPKTIFIKGWLFLLLSVLSATTLLLYAFSWQVALLLAITVWATCRWYYFMFYVIEKYVDPTYRFAGLVSFLRYVLHAKKQASNFEGDAQ